MNSPRERRPKVCFVIPSLEGGGAERVAVQVLNALDDRRWDRWMYLFDRTGPYLADVSPSVRLEAGGARSRLARWFALCRFLRRARPDVVVVFLSYPSVLTAARAAGVGARVIFDVETPVTAFLADSDYQWSRRWYRRVFAVAMRISCAMTDRIVATSRGVADDLVATYGVPPTRISIVPNPVDVRAVRSAAEEPIEPSHAGWWTRPVIVSAGRLAEAKNYPLLIEAFAILRAQMGVTLFILGAGEQERALRDLIHARGLDDAAHLCGFQTNPWKYMARADVFALTSRYEGFGNVLVESMACGVPVVATGSAGTRDVVSSGVDGLLVEQHEPAAFAAALAEVLGHAGLRQRMSQAARLKAERYRTELVASTYDTVLTEALA